MPEIPRSVWELPGTPESDPPFEDPHGNHGAFCTLPCSNEHWGHPDPDVEAIIMDDLERVHDELSREEEDADGV